MGFAPLNPPYDVSTRQPRCYSSPMTAEEIEEAVLKLPPDELAKFRVWFAEFERGMAPPIVHHETMATKIGRLAGRTIADFRKRTREP